MVRLGNATNKNKYNAKGTNKTKPAIDNQAITRHKKSKPLQSLISIFMKGTPIMTTNSIIKNKTFSQNMSSAKRMGKGVIDIAGALDGLKNSTNGFDRIMSAIGLIKGGKALFDKK